MPSVYLVLVPCPSIDWVLKNNGANISIDLVIVRAVRSHYR